MKSIGILILLAAGSLAGQGCEPSAPSSPLELPAPRLSRAERPKEPEVRLDVYPDGKYVMEGKSTKDLAVLKAWLVEQHKVQPKAAVVLYSSKDLEWGTVQPLMLLVSDVGYSKVIFCARADEPEAK